MMPAIASLATELTKESVQQRQWAVDMTLSIAKRALAGSGVTVKIKWADFQISSRSRSIEAPIETRAKLHELALELIRSVFPPPKAIRLVGVTLSNFRSPTAGSEAELPFRKI